MRILTTANQKGGVGKTVTALNLGQSLARKGIKTLLVDLDPQSTLTTIFIRETVEESLYDFLGGKGKAQDFIYSIDNNLFVFPANNRLSRVEREAEEDFTLLKKGISRIRGYDVMIIDSPPSLGVLTANALTAADFVLIPTKTDYLNLQTIISILGLAYSVQENHNQGLEILPPLPTQFDSRRVLDRQVLDLLKKRFNKVLKPIRQNVDIAVAPSWGQSIFQYSPKSKGSEDYRALVNYINKKIGS